MKDRHEIELPSNVCSDLTDAQFDKMIEVALSLEPLWENALGKDWRKQISYYSVRALYEQM